MIASTIFTTIMYADDTTIERVLLFKIKQTSIEKRLEIPNIGINNQQIKCVEQFDLLGLILH